MDIGSRVRLAASIISLAPEIAGSSVRSRPRSRVGAPFEAFVDSMPAAYRNLYDDASMRAHAAIVERRGGRAARVEAWKHLPAGVVAICVVTDDVVGLSTRVCAAVFANGAEVVGAQVYRRARGDLATEAIGLFWIRRPASSPPVNARDLASIRRTLEPLLRGTGGLLLAARLSRAVDAAGRSRGRMRA